MIPAMAEPDKMPELCEVSEGIEDIVTIVVDDNHLKKRKGFSAIHA